MRQLASRRMRRAVSDGVEIRGAGEAEAGLEQVASKAADKPQEYINLIKVRPTCASQQPCPPSLPSLATAMSSVSPQSCNSHVLRLFARVPFDEPHHQGDRRAVNTPSDSSLWRASVGPIHVPQHPWPQAVGLRQFAFVSWPSSVGLRPPLPRSLSSRRMVASSCCGIDFKLVKSA